MYRLSVPFFWLKHLYDFTFTALLYSLELVHCIPFPHALRKNLTLLLDFVSRVYKVTRLQKGIVY